MNLFIIAVLAATACVVKGHNNDISESEENGNGKCSKTATREEDVSSEQREDRPRYWPQIVIIKPTYGVPIRPHSRGAQNDISSVVGKRPGAPRRPNYYGNQPVYVFPNGLKYTFPTRTLCFIRNKIYICGLSTEKKIHPRITIPTTTTTEWPEIQESTSTVATTTVTTTKTPTTTKPDISVSSQEPLDQTTKPENKSCSTPNGGQGNCISIYDCQPLLALVNKGDRTSQEVELLKRSQCGFKGSSPAVCCPSQTEQTQRPPSGTCYTPEGNEGRCISLYSCPHIANMLKPPVPQETIAYVQKSKCQGPDMYSVCCGNGGGNRDVTPGNCPAKMNAFPPDPRTECCGVDGRVGNKIVGGNATTVDQYPWLVMIEYVKLGVTKLLCGGALISGKYVLTAGHCVVGQVLDVGTPKRVRLGEYDISHEGADCAPVEAGGEDCTDGVTKIDIEKIIPHPQYNPVSPKKRNDIALLRLKDTAPFTDFIRPICLPERDLTLPQNRPANFTLYAAGWGAVSTRQAYSNVKLHVDLPFVPPEKCQPAYSLPGRSVTLWNGQLCAGGENGKDSCKGDSGGPLMYENGRTYEIIGVVSFGPVPCGMEGIPGVYSKVYEYLDWIRSSIVP